MRTKGFTNRDRLCNVGWLAMLLLLVAGCGDSKWSMLGDYDIVVDTDDEKPVALVSLSFDRYLGEGVIDGTLNVMAASSSGMVAMAEKATCRITAFDIHTDSLIYQVGKCGSGPEEFDGVSGLAFDGDILYAWDYGQSQLVAISSAGKILNRRSVLRMSGGRFSALDKMAAIGPGLLGTMVPRAAQGEDEAAIIDLNREEIVRTFWRQPVAAQDGETVRGIGPNFCGAIWGGRPVIVSVNTWMLETEVGLPPAL